MLLHCKQSCQARFKNYKDLGQICFKVSDKGQKDDIDYGSMENGSVMKSEILNHVLKLTICKMYSVNYNL